MSSEQAFPPARRGARGISRASATYQLNVPVPATIVQQVHQADFALAQAILGRDRKATARFVELHADSVNAYVWRRLAPRVEMVDDIVQEVFLAAWRALNSYNGHAPLEGWVLAIARFKVEDYYRRILSRPLADLELEGESAALAVDVDLAGDLDDRRAAERAGAILEELPYEYALALRWRYWEGQSAKAMAALSGRSEKAIERLLARARDGFKLRWVENERKGGAAK